MVSQRLPIRLLDLFLHDFQQFHRACFDADAAGNALGGGAAFLEHDHVHGAGFGALAAADALLLVDHVHAGLGVLGDGFVLTGTHTLAALNAGVGLGAGTLGHDADTALLLVKFLIERLGTGGDALQTCHALHIFLSSELLHSTELSFIFYSLSLYMSMQEKATKNFRKSDFASYHMLTCKRK